MSKPLDRLALLETFVRIAERGTISAAAADLGMAQGSASRQLKELEERLGVQLIRRTTHSLALTEAGQDLLVRARKLISAWEILEEQHRSDGDDIRGSLRIVAPVALGQLYLVDIVIAYQAANQGVKVDWRLEDEPIRFAEVGCDCWIKVGPVPDDTLIVRRLAGVERMVVAAPALAARMSSKDPAAIEALPFATLTPFEGEKIALSGQSGERVDVAVRSRISMNNIMSLKRTALAGLGAAILPNWLVAEELCTGALVDLLPEWRASMLDVNLAYLPARQQPKRLLRFFDALESGLVAIPGLSRQVT